MIKGRSTEVTITFKGGGEATLKGCRLLPATMKCEVTERAFRPGDEPPWREYIQGDFSTKVKITFDVNPDTFATLRKIADPFQQIMEYSIGGKRWQQVIQVMQVREDMIEFLPIGEPREVVEDE